MSRKMYQSVKLDISQDQRKKLHDAVRLRKSVSIKTNVNSKGKQKFLLTNSQVQRIERARLIGKKTATIHLSKKQVIANVEYKGGFLSTLLGLAARALPTILGGLTTGLISGGENCDKTNCHNCINVVKLYMEPDVCEETDFKVKINSKSLASFNFISIYYINIYLHRIW